jgi:hypothetical protein
MASVITCTRASKTTRSCEQKPAANRVPPQVLFVYCLDARKGEVLQQQRNVAGAREENVALTPCSVSDTCSECCAPQTSLSRPFFVLVDIGGPGACQVLTVARHSRLFRAPVTCLLFHMRGTKGGIERVSRSQGAQHQARFDVKSTPMLPEGCNAIAVVLWRTTEALRTSRVCCPKLKVDKAFVPREWTTRASATESGACIE